MLSQTARFCGSNYLATWSACRTCPASARREVAGSKLPRLHRSTKCHLRDIGSSVCLPFCKTIESGAWKESFAWRAWRPRRPWTASYSRLGSGMSGRSASEVQWGLGRSGTRLSTRRPMCRPHSSSRSCRQLISFAHPTAGPESSTRAWTPLTIGPWRPCTPTRKRQHALRCSYPTQAVPFPWRPSFLNVLRPGTQSCTVAACSSCAAMPASR
mmetsp:Transcript_33260/g.107565  ORF Transcript_33260/g.107565 Transcript_33260/m.107565 type:complete len:213 (-) Transcript_33260:3909-4547(-)